MPLITFTKLSKIVDPQGYPQRKTANQNQLNQNQQCWSWFNRLKSAERVILSLSLSKSTVRETNLKTFSKTSQTLFCHKLFHGNHLLQTTFVNNKWRSGILTSQKPPVNPGEKKFPGSFSERIGVWFKTSQRHKPLYFLKHNGDDRDRTGNLRLARAALSQLSYVP